MLTGMHPVDRLTHPHINPCHMSAYEGHATKHDFSSLHFPVPISSIGSFATKNNLSKKVIYLLRVTETVVADRHVDLLLYECNEVQHYTTIKNFSRLISRQMSNHGRAIYCCKKCLHAYSIKELLEAHAKDCCHTQRTYFPKDPRCLFTNIQKQLPTPFVVYADFESILKPVNEDVDVTQGVDTDTKSPAHVYQEHVPCSFAYKIVRSFNPNFSRPLVIYRGEDAADVFVSKLQLEAEQLCDDYIATQKTMLFTGTDSQSFTSVTTCHICTNLLGEDKVHDHCHITGNCHGAAHNECNLNYRIKLKSWKLPVVIHNLKGYDGHFIVKSLKSEFGKLWVVPQIMEKISIFGRVGQLRFLDSFQFTSQRLDKLVKTLGEDEFKYLRESFNSDHSELVRRKGVYPYDYMNSVDRLEERNYPLMYGVRAWILFLSV